MLAKSARIIGGAGVVVLSFWITLKVLEYLHSEAAGPSRTITCRIPLGAQLPEPGQAVPVVTIGESGRADVVFLRNDGKQVFLGIDDWGLDHKERAIDSEGIRNGVLNIVADYSHNVLTVSLGQQEALRRSGPLSSTFTKDKITIGKNQIGNPGISPAFPPVL